MRERRGSRRPEYDRKKGEQETGIREKKRKEKQKTWIWDKKKREKQ
jgi:hypothetical protein